MLYNFRSRQYIGTLNLNLREQMEQAIATMISICNEQIETVLREMDQGIFPYSEYSFERSSSSGLTGKAGIYLIVNKESKRFYIGGSYSLDLRKADYARGFREQDPGRANAGSTSGRNRVYKSMRPDLAAHGKDSFSFIPLLLISPQQINLASNGKSLQEQLKTVFDLNVEPALLTPFLNPNHPRHSLVYNTELVGQFLPDNTRGGGPTSGEASQPLAFRNLCAWESRSAWGNSLNRDRQLSKSKLQSTDLRLITGEEFEVFSGVKVMNANAKGFFNEPERYALFRQLAEGLNLSPKSSDPPVWENGEL